MVFVTLEWKRVTGGWGGGIPVFYSDCQLRAIREGGRDEVVQSIQLETGTNPSVYPLRFLHSGDERRYD